jgi:glycosyltransferase involved in cell wall biosynthesis
MRILVVAPQPFFTPRGTPFSVYYRAVVMAEQGVELDLLTYGSGQDIDVAGVRMSRIPRFRLLEPIPVGPSWRKLFLDLFMIIWTIALLVKHRYPVVHAHEEAVFWCRPLKRIFGFRLIYDMHSSLPQQLDNFRFTRSRLLIRTFRALEDTCLNASDAVITICPDLRDYALKAGVDPARHLLIENSIFDDVRLKARTADGTAIRSGVECEFDPQEKVILYAGTFEAYQGIETLVEAFANVVSRRPHARLLLVGGTEEQVARIRSLVAERGLADTCRLTGRVSKTEALRFTQLAHVLVSPRLHGTNTPLKIYEQLASGKPLVATRIWSHTQVLDERVCYLVDPSPESLANGIVEALDDLGRTSERVTSARALYEREYARPVYEGKIRQLLGIVA